MMLRLITVLSLIFAVVLGKASGQLQNGQAVLGLMRRVHIQPNTEVDKPFLSLSTTLNIVNLTDSQTTLIKQQDGATEATEETVEPAGPAETEDTIKRIIGGRRVSINEVPWQAAVISDGYFVCGASIVSTIWVLTAAHCIYGHGNSTFVVRAGSDTFRSGGQARRVGFTAVHGQYSPKTFSNDVAMLKTTRRFTFGISIQPIRVPNASQSIPTNFFITGWGSTSSTNTSPTRHLRGVHLNRVNRRTCKKNYAGTQYTITANMICASTSGRDSCQGDSGGGLTNNGMIYGIVSFGIGCANSSYPGVNTNVPYMSSWILNVARTFSRRRNIDFLDPDSERGVNIILV